MPVFLRMLPGLVALIGVVIMLTLVGTDKWSDGLSIAMAYLVLPAVLENVHDAYKSIKKERREGRRVTTEEIRDFIVSKQHHMIKEYKTVRVEVVTPDTVYFRRGDKTEKLNLRNFYELTKL